jgi:hypothetical protein
MKNPPLSRFEMLLCCWIVGVIFYLVDCEGVTLFRWHQDIPWIQRGPYVGPGLLFTVGCFVFPLFDAIRDRIRSQPPR